LWQAIDFAGPCIPRLGWLVKTCGSIQRLPKQNILFTMTTSRLDHVLSSSEGMARVFSPRNTVQRMLDVEAALVTALAAEGVIPQSAVAAIVDACKSDLIDLDALLHEAALAGNLAIPLVKQLTVQVAAHDADAARHVHWGATSQDVIDTGMVLQLREALQIMTFELAELADALAAMVQRYRSTPMIGRTWMQHALPISFGLKVAGWLDAVMRHQDRLILLRHHVAVLQFGGAAGSLASLGDQGLTVAQALAKQLELELPATPWHGHRDRLAEVATTLGLLTGTLGKIARDISLQMQTEIAEVSERVAVGRGGSSTMPHKRNPVGCAAVLAASVRVPALVSTMLSAMVQEHERALGGWQAEWDVLPEIAELAGVALMQLRAVIEGLQVNEARMRSNIDITRGLVMAEAVSLALGRQLGRAAAHELVESACARAIATSQPLQQVMLSDERIMQQLSAAELATLVDPENYLGQARAFADRVLAVHRQRKA
jgi:3-carboxy-cis,cis-muconate cycloisomerase